MSSAKITLIGMYNWDNTLFDNLQIPDGVDKATLIENILIRSGEFEVMYSDFDFMKFSIGAWSRKWYPTLERWIDALSIRYNPLENYDRQEEWTDNRDINGTEDSTNTGSRTGSDTRTENRSENENGSGSDTRTESGSSNASTSGSTNRTDTTSVSAYDAVGDTFTPREKLVVDGTDSSESSTLTSLTVSGSNTDLRMLSISVSAADASSLTLSDIFNKTNKTDDDLTHKGRIHGNIGVTTSQQMLQAELDLGYWNLYEKITDLFLTEFTIPVY